MKVKPVVLAVAAVATLAVASSVTVMRNAPLENCVGKLKEKANVEGRKMVAPNQDGGLFLLVETPISNRISFNGFLGPKSANTLKDQMIENGLLQVEVKVEGQCETESGLVYTVVSGHYEVPAQKPDPI